MAKFFMVVEQDRETLDPTEVYFLLASDEDEAVDLISKETKISTSFLVPYDLDEIKSKLKPYFEISTKADYFSLADEFKNFKFWGDKLGC